MNSAAVMAIPARSNRHNPMTAALRKVDTLI
jgi:hypothetical protein